MAKKTVGWVLSFLLRYCDFDFADYVVCELSEQVLDCYVAARSIVARSK